MMHLLSRMHPSSYDRDRRCGRRWNVSSRSSPRRRLERFAWTRGSRRACRRLAAPLFRNVIAHEYDALSAATVWDIARNELPGLAADAAAELARRDAERP